MTPEAIGMCIVSGIGGFLLGVLYMGVYAVTVAYLEDRKANDPRSANPERK